MRVLASLLALFAPAKAVGGVPDPKLIRVELVRFMLTEEKMGQRIDTESLAPYVKKLIAAGESFARAQPGRPTAVTLTVAVKAGGERRIWAAAEASSRLPAAKLLALERELKKVASPDPREIIVFQVLVQLWGGSPKGEEVFPSMPEAWLREVKRAGKPLEVEELVGMVWD